MSSTQPSRGESLANKVAIVTGSTRGIGAGIAERFGAEGAAVVVSGRSTDAGKRVAADIRAGGGEATFVRTDMRDPESIENLVAETVDAHETVDILVNNAAVQTETTATEATLDDWDSVLETDFRAYWLAVKHAVEYMPEGGSIINMSSNHAFATMPGLFPYNAVKAGINGMSRAMALELGPLGIRVNTINPGWVAVERTEAELERTDREHVEAIHPLGRIGTPEDVAGVAAFLASEDAAFMTGASVPVDGGRQAVMEDREFLSYKQDRSDRH